MIHMVLEMDMGRTKKPLGIGIRLLMHLARWERFLGSMVLYSETGTINWA
jgi:hypothetical protein